MEYHWQSKNEGRLIDRDENGNRRGYMEIMLTETEKLVIKHTEVSAGYAGKGNWPQIGRRN